MNHHAVSRNPDRLAARLGTATVAAAAILGAAALLNGRRARQAERSDPPRGRFLKIDGIHLHYVDRGAGSPVILLHGNGAMVQDYDISGLIDRLAKRNRVIAFDRPGFGYTNRPRAQEWTPAAQARLIHRALMQLGVKTSVVIGHSWGTLVALALALDHPAAVRALVLVSGYYFPTLRADVAALSPLAAPILGDLLRYTITPWLGRALWRPVIRQLFAPAPVSLRFAAAFPRELSLRPSQIKALAADTALMVPSAAALAKRYRELVMPVVIIAGTGDRIVGFARHSLRLHAILPQSQLISVAGAGHMIHHTVPEQVIAAIDLAAACSSKEDRGELALGASGNAGCDRRR